jgi:hypothetical protein
MKAVPILAVTSTLALAAAIYLFVRVDELEGQLRTRRGGGVANGTAVDEAALEERILERLSRRGARAPDRPPAAEVGDRAVVASEWEGSASPAGSAPVAAADPEEAGDLPAAIAGREMEVFRRNVRKANALNQEEDRIRRVVDSLDRLVSENKIAALDKGQKKQIALTLVSARERIPEVFRTLRSDPALRELPREERTNAWRQGMESVRIEAQKELEEFVPAADAKTILDDSLRTGRGFGGGFDRGPRPPSRPGR